MLEIARRNLGISRTDVGKFSFVNRTITEWNQLTEGAIGTSPFKTHINLGRRLGK
jgi:hypothetical protein